MSWIISREVAGKNEITGNDHKAHLCANQHNSVRPAPSTETKGKVGKKKEEKTEEEKKREKVMRQRGSSLRKQDWKIG